MEEGLKTSMKKAKIMFDNHEAGRQVMIGNRTLEMVEEYSFLGQTVNGNTTHERDNQKENVNAMDCIWQT